MHRIPPTIFALALVSGSCSSNPESSATPTYSRDVKPIVDAKCVGCHVDGGIAPFELTTHADIASRKALVQAVVETRQMPPWPASRDCNSFANDASLSDAQLKTIVDWIAAGAPEGDAAAGVAGNPKPLQHVDRSLEPPEAYTPTQSPDEYRCFLLDWPETETRYLTGYNVEPGNREIVHHVIAYLIEADDLDTYEALEAAEPDPGYACFGGPGGTDDEGGDPGPGAAWLASWAPGTDATEFPAGTGIAIAPGSKIVLQVHYNAATPDAAPDRTRIDLQLASEIEKAGAFMPFTNIAWVDGTAMHLPAGEPDVVHQFETDASVLVGLVTESAVPSGPFRIHAAALHMHLLGTRANLVLRRANGESVCLLDIADWNFHWQRLYQFSHEVAVEPGDMLGIECHWDNSAGAATDVYWGEGTHDEMCLGLLYVTP